MNEYLKGTTTFTLFNRPRLLICSGVLVVLVYQLMREVGGDRIIRIGNANTSHIERTNHTQREKAFFPFSIQYHSFIQSKQSLHLVGVVSFYRQQHTRDMNTLGNLDITRRVNVMVIGGREVNNRGIQVIRRI